MTITILENLTTNTTSDWFPIISQGKLNLYVVGDLSAGVLTIEAMAPDGVTPVLVDNGTITAEGMYQIEAASFLGRAKLTGGVTPNVSVYIEVENTDLREIILERM